MVVTLCSCEPYHPEVQPTPPPPGLACVLGVCVYAGDDGILCVMAGAWISLVGALVGSTVAVLVSWASVGACLGCLAGVFLVLLDGGALLPSQSQVSLLFAVLIVGGIGFSLFQVRQWARMGGVRPRSACPCRCMCVLRLLRCLFVS